MPKKMRRTLYLKDDDWRMSFLMGSYITLTNLKEEEIQRIIDQRISPLYVSVHAYDDEMRKLLFGNPDAVKTFGIDVYKRQHKAWGGSGGKSASGNQEIAWDQIIISFCVKSRPAGAIFFVNSP